MTTRLRTRPADSRHGGRRFALLLGLASVGTFVAAGTVSAHYIYQQAIVASPTTSPPSPAICVENRAEVSHGSRNSGYFKFDVKTLSTYNYNGYPGCVLQSTPPQPAGHIALQSWAYTYNFSSGQWYACFKNGGSGPGDPWLRNSTSTNKLVWAYSVPSPTPPCGTGSYHTTGTGITYVQFIWQGGDIWSGNNHWLPS